MVKIGHAVYDENGKAVGGRAGDQTGKEICIRQWYDSPWNVYLVCTDLELAKKAAEIMKQICSNDSFGYDQGQRLTGYESIKKNKGKIEGASGEFDCSSLVSACYKLAGLDISVANTTRSLREALLATGKFVAYKDSSHLRSDAYAKVGGVYIREGGHVVMSLENGGNRTNPYAEPTENVKLGDKGSSVKWVQFELSESGFATRIDGEFGEKTEDAVVAFQHNHDLAEDGIVGQLTKAKMKEF